MLKAVHIAVILDSTILEMEEAFAAKDEERMNELVELADFLFTVGMALATEEKKRLH